MYTIYAGLYLESETRITRDSSSPVKESTASKLIRHENYNEGTKANDIALIKLSKPLELTKEVQVACLPNPEKLVYPPRNQDCWTVGWGKLSEDGIQPDELYNVKLTTYNGTMCKYVAFGVPKVGSILDIIIMDYFVNLFYLYFRIGMLNFVQVWKLIFLFFGY